MRLAMVVALLWATPAQAVSDAAKAKAEKHKQRAFELLAEGAHSEAINELDKAYRAVAHPAFLYNIAVAYDQWPGHCAETVAAFERFFADCRGCRLRATAHKRMSKVRARCEVELTVETLPPGAVIRLDGAGIGTAPLRHRAIVGDHALVASLEGYDAQQRQITLEPETPARVRFELAARLPRPRLVLANPPEGSTVLIDGVEIEATPDGVPLEPGAHRVTVIERSGARAETVSTLAAGERVVLDLQGVPSPASTSSALPALGWSGVAVGVVGGIVATAFAITSNRAVDEEAAERMRFDGDLDTVNELRSTAVRDAWVANIAGGVGIAFAVTGVALLIADAVGSDKADKLPGALSLRF